MGLDSNDDAEEFGFTFHHFTVVREEERVSL
jgi:hypothetical protein